MTSGIARRGAGPMLFIGYAFVIGVVIRWWLLGASQGALSADEAYTGLQAFRILDGDLPLVIEGQAYTAVFDSYLLAPILAIVGPSVLVLKVMPMIWWLIASVLVGRLAATASDRVTGLGAGAVFWVTPGALLILSTRAYEGYGLGLIFVLVTCLVALRASSEQGVAVRTSASCGFTAGLAFYAHPMYAAVLLPALLFPFWKNRRLVRVWAVPFFLAAVSANVPLLAWNARNGWDSLRQPVVPSSTYWERLGDLFTEMIPRVLGLRDLDGSWTMGVVVAICVLVTVASFAVVGSIELVRASRANWVIVLPLAVGWPILAVFRSVSFVADGRYGVVLFPFVVVAAATGFVRVSRGLPNGFIALGLTVWTAVLALPWVAENSGARRGDPNSDVIAVVELVQSRGHSTISGSFWWVLPVEYLSGRDIRGGVAGEPFTIRVVDSQAEVAATPDDRVPFVFDAGREQVDVLRMSIDSYDRHEVGDAVVYLPRAGGGG